MKFDVVIGNPPYQDERQGTSTTALPIYHTFMEAAYKVGKIVELITPARFLFDAGRTPKEWNERMLQDPHLKVLFYEQDASKMFSNTDIKGGVVITYRDEDQDFGAIETFVVYSEVNDILRKVKPYLKNMVRLGHACLSAQNLIQRIYLENILNMKDMNAECRAMFLNLSVSMIIEKNTIL